MQVHLIRKLYALQLVLPTSLLIWIKKPEERVHPLKREVFSVGEVNPNIRVKGSTPPSTKSGTVDGHPRRQLCETPFFIILCNKDGKFMGGKQCGLCKRQTRFY